ncbi:MULTISPECIES: twin-arginine translocase subunit TatC [Flavobacterium]|uniref:Sec-independent protein translocase protein TatC n=1 Tax=Flavobacterium covae TaxID=2906076 RepID=A0ABW8PFN3_9FLAO|nr:MULTISPECIES: twin-arginine translocase subunit TatC [Flavobacterium]OXA83864.1 twin arginine-targeting protein translocase TatC [Flavobacterium columnare NBRC 100251 = ATCC 23463]AMA49829.1 preprotein translocase subunit TatC [Flavobacterium covae]AND64643.1 preprotein translocase subunit TatC [Flavobacterium covae]MCJ1805889.1 twin-arginine translocase subunit TatC [Flavobacterium covae]MCJ1809839.1 twin-arginine translocase subunit TatC [Flavobacterium covae]
MAKKNLSEMSFLDHLEELRWLLIRSTITIVILAIVVFFFADFIFDQIIFGPTRVEFVTYRFFCDASHYLGFADTICIEELPFTIQNTSMEGQVNVFVWMCITAGFILGFPYILWELWRFISPALYDNEKKYAKVFIISASILFFIGVLFGYYVIVPMSVNFLASFSISSVVKNDIDLNSYIGMVKTSVLAGGIFFEMPIIIYLLTKLGLIKPSFLQNTRKYAIVIVLIIAAIVTPPDVVSQVTVAVPMLLIYEMSIIISRIVYKNQLKEQNG